MITAPVGTDEATCKSGEGDGWYSSLEDYEAQTFVVTLVCDPFVGLAQFRAARSSSIADHEPPWARLCSEGPARGR